MDAAIGPTTANGLAKTMAPKNQRDLVGQYFAGFRAGNHQQIPAALTDGVEWIIYGHRTTGGRAVV